MSPVSRFFPVLLAVLGTALLSGGPAPAAHPLHWDWPSGESFTDLEWQGTGLDAAGTLVAGPNGESITLAGAEVCWSVAPDGQGGFYAGTGHEGQIFHTDADGETSLFANLEGSEVFSLLVLADGRLLAGTGPDGRLFRVSRGGEATAVGQVPGGYIWSLLSHQDQVYLACGSPAALYRLTDESELEQVAVFPALNALDVAPGAGGDLLVCTQGPGLVYRLDPATGPDAWLLCEVEQDEVRQFVPGPDGLMHFLALRNDDSSPNQEQDPRRMPPVSAESLRGGKNGLSEKPAQAALFRLSSDGRPLPVWSGNLDLMVAAYSPRHGWLGGTALDSESGLSRLFGLEVQGGQHLVARWPGGDILALVPLADGILAVAQAHPGGVRLLRENRDQRAVAVSPPLDAGRPVHWGRLSHRRTDGKSARFAVRAGNRSVPDDSWTDWSGRFSGEDEALDLPVSRYLQWRVELPAAGSRVQTVSVSARADNAPPTIRRFTLENLSEVSEGSIHGGGENVTQTFESGLRVEFGRKSQVSREVGLDRSAFTRPVRILTWQGEDPDEDSLLYTLEYRRQDDTVWRTILEETPEGLGSWDTGGLPDGSYQLRLTASDHRDNPLGEGLQATRETGPVRVDNTPPEMKNLRLKALAEGVRIRCEVQDAGSALAEAWLLLPDGERRPLLPADGICDSRREQFDTVVPWAGSPRPWVFGVEAWDLAGNPVRGEGVLR